MLQFIIDKKLASTSFDKYLNEQTVTITKLGIDIITILEKLHQDSIESEKTNIFAAERLANEEKEP